MQTKNINFISSIAILTVALFISYILIVQALTKEDIVFPVAELGGCQDEEGCKVYCDKPENLDACLDFAEKYNLMTAEEIRKARLLGAIGEGPGGCTSEDSCEAYCDDIAHINECIAFAEEHGLMSQEELVEAKKVQAAIARGIQPPLCGSKKRCEVYCSQPEHMEECMEFAIAAGLMPPGELIEAQKMMAAIKKGINPPPCTGKKDCDAYCSQPKHMKECTEFAIAAGFMSLEKAEEMKKTFKAIEMGIMPPPCKGEKECDAYCSQPEHVEECIRFAVAAGLMSPEDAEMTRKTGGKGPGDCKGKEECEAFCNNPANQEICFDFSKKYGLIPEEDLRQMEEGKQQMQDTLNNASLEVIQCLNEKLGFEVVEKLKTGTAMPSQEVGDTMKACFEMVGPPPGAPADGMPPGGEHTPPPTEEYCVKVMEDGSVEFPDKTRIPADEVKILNSSVEFLDGKVIKSCPPPFPPGGTMYPPEGEYIPPPTEKETTPPPSSEICVKLLENGSVEFPDKSTISADQVNVLGDGSIRLSDGREFKLCPLSEGATKLTPYKTLITAIFTPFFHFFLNP